MALATLSIDLVARLAQFQQGLDQAGRLAEARANTIRSAFDGIKTAGLAVGGALATAFAAGGAVAAFVNRLNAPLLAMKDLSEATGATIENVSALENVARNAGASFDVVQGALVKFNQSLNAADKPTAAVSEALKRIGLNAEELKRLDPALALREVALALAGYADDGEKARLVQELFGKSVRETAPLLKELAEQTQFAATVTTEQVLAADKLNKEIAALKKNAEDAGRAIAGTLVPVLNRLFASYRESGGISGLFAQSLVDGGAKQQAARLRELVTEMEGLQKAIDDIENRGGRGGERQLRAYRETLAARRAEADRLLREQATYAESLKGLAERIDPQGEAATPLAVIPPVRAAVPVARGAAAVEQRLPITPEQATLVEALRRLENTDEAKLQSLRGQLEALVRLVQQGGAVDGSVFANIADELARLDPAAIAATERINTINAALAATPAAQLESASRLARELYDELGRTTDPAQIEKINQALDALREKLGLVAPEAEKVGDTMSTFAEQASRNIQDALGDTLEQALSGNFRNIGQLWVQTLQRMAAQAAAARLNELIFSTLGGSSNPFLAAIGNLFKGGRADGGAVDSGGTYLVGERGPELLTFPRSGYVTSAERLRMGGMGGGSGVTYSPTVVIQGDVGPATVALVERALARERARSMRMAYASGAA